MWAKGVEDMGTMREPSRVVGRINGRNLRRRLAGMMGWGGAAFALAMAAPAETPVALRETQWLKLGEEAVLRLRFDRPPRPEFVRVLLAPAKRVPAPPPRRPSFMAEGLRFFRRVEDTFPAGWESVGDLAAVVDGETLTLLWPREVVAPLIRWAIEITDDDWRTVARQPASGWNELIWNQVAEAQPVRDEPPPQGDALLELPGEMGRRLEELQRRPWRPLIAETDESPASSVGRRVRFALRDADAEEPHPATPARVETDGKALRRVGECAGIRWRLYFLNEADGVVSLIGEIEAENERRVEAILEYELAEGDWVWHDDFVSSQALRGASAPLRNTWIWPFGSGEQSRYPVGVVSRAGKTVVMEAHPDTPSVFRLEAVDHPARLRTAFDLGLTPLTARLARRAFFVVSVYEMTTGEKPPFRAAWEHFQRRYPELFHRRVRDIGLWLPVGATASPEFEALGPLWGCAQISRPRFLPTMPFHARWPLDSTGTSDPAEALRRLRFFAAFDRGSVGLSARTALLGGARQTDGTLAVEVRDEEGMLEVNAHPSLLAPPSQPLNRGQAEWAAIRASLQGGECAGVYVDGASRLRALDTNRAALAVSTLPATWRAGDRAIGLAGPLAALDYLRPLAQAMRSSDALLAVDVSGVSPPSLSLVGDILVTVETAPLNEGTSVRWNALRALAGTKPVVAILEARHDEWTPDQFHAWMKNGLLLGFVLAPGPSLTRLAHGDELRRPSRDYSLWLTYFPWQRRLAELGWTPLGRAIPRTRGWRVEQFGSDPNGVLALTAQRGTDAPAEGEIEWILDHPAVLMNPMEGQCEEIRPVEGRTIVRWRAAVGQTLLRVVVPWEKIVAEAAFLRAWPSPEGEAAALLSNLRTLAIEREAEVGGSMRWVGENGVEVRIENRADRPLVVSEMSSVMDGRTRMLTDAPRILAPGETLTQRVEFAPADRRPREWLELRWRLGRAEREWICTRHLRFPEQTDSMEEMDRGKP